MKFLLAVYSHPEYYPPTLNAIGSLSDQFEKVTVLSRNIKSAEWEYPKNVNLELSGEFKTIRDSEKANSVWKFISFLKFTFDFYKIIKKEKSDWVICYDPIPLFTFRIIRPFLRYKPKLWYHNHDVLELSKTGKYSISRMAVKNEEKYFNQIDIFSLPAEERKELFPITKLKGTYFFIPNYPSIKMEVHRSSFRLKKENSLKLIYQGHIGEGHGLVQIINFIKNNQTGINVSLTIIGFADEDFKQLLLSLINSLELESTVSVLEPLPYKQLFAITTRHDVGLAIHQPLNVMLSTGATSSNKIYEYLAVGMPVLMYDNSIYKQMLNTREWAYFTDLTEKSIETSLISILKNYELSAEKAQNDFKTELNFESHFNIVTKHISNQN